MRRAFLRQLVLLFLVLLGGACGSVPDVRTMTSKKFKIPGPSIERIAPGHGACIASDRILVDGCPVGYMIRTEPHDDVDSGWQFYAGDESQDYCDQSANFGVYDLNTVCNYDRSIIPLLDTQAPVAFERDTVTGKFVRSSEAPDE